MYQFVIKLLELLILDMPLLKKLGIAFNRKAKNDEFLQILYQNTETSKKKIDDC